MTPAVLDTVEQLSSGQDVWDNVGDCSGEFYMLWDDVNIYMAVVVTDDKLSMNKSGADIWNSDCVEVLFATTEALASHSWANPTIHYQYGFNANNQKWNWCSMDGPGQSEPDYLQIATTETADGYICEASIEYAQMSSLDFSAGNTIGFHPCIDDTDIDNGDTEYQMSWIGLPAHDQSFGFGHMVLSDDSVGHMVLSDDSVSAGEADTLSGLADVTVVDGAIVSVRDGETEYVVADGDLILGTTTRWYIEGGVETLWAEGDPAPAATVSGTSNPKEGDVGSKADNFNFTLDGGTNISSIDGIDYQETIFPSLVDTIILFERGGNDVGTWQAILADGSLGEAVEFVKSGDGGPYADTGAGVNGQNAYGVVFKTSEPVQGVRITASGHDTLSISAPVYVEPPVTIPVTNAGFEDPVLAEDDWTWLEVSGWTWIGGEGPGIWHVTIADFDPVIAPEGQNILYTENAVGDAGGVAQVLTETFAANTDYTLTVEVGNSYFYYFAGYSVQLLAGGTVIAEDNDTLWPEYMNWATSTVVYTYNPADSALVGQPLEIRLLNLGLDKDNPPDNTVGVEFDNVTLSYVAGAESGVTIPVDPSSDLAAANALANPGDTMLFAEGTYNIASQIEIKDGVTYKGAGPGLTIIDGNGVTRAFAAFGDRSLNDGNENPNDSGPKGWVLEEMTIQNCVADTNNRFSYAGAAFNMLDDFADNDADASGGLNADEANDDVGAIRLAGADATEGTEDDDLHRFAAMDADGNGELSEAELSDQLLSTEVEFPDEDGDGGAITIHNESVGTIANCDFLNNHTPAEGDGDDGGAINITGRSTITINDCWFEGNYACSPDSTSIDGADGDGGHIKAQGNNLTNGFINIGTTLIVNRCVFMNGNAEDDGGAIQAPGQGIVVRIDSCWFEGNTSWDNGNVLQFPNEDQHEVTVTNCVFANNITKADNSPDRMIETRRNSKFVNCTFVGNIQEDQDLIYNNADAADGDHDGTDDETADVTQVVNCIFANNVVGNGDDVLGSRNASFTIAATNCLFFGNTLQNGNAADNTQRPADEMGSVLSDPLLDADLVPGAGSEAIDGGVDPATVGVTLTTDYNGNERPKGAAYDIGAHESE
jgi:hypothetical protein